MILTPSSVTVKSDVFPVSRSVTAPAEASDSERRPGGEDLLTNKFICKAGTKLCGEKFFRERVFVFWPGAVGVTEATEQRGSYMRQKGPEERHQKH